MGDKGYDSRANREAARQRGIAPVIPRRKTAKTQVKHFPRALYRGRARIEQLIGKIKRFKRIALRCEKTATHFSSFLALVCAFIWIKFVHRA
jgi:IS5 family transposase